MLFWHFLLDKKVLSLFQIFPSFLVKIPYAEENRPNESFMSTVQTSMFSLLGNRFWLVLINESILGILLVTFESPRSGSNSSVWLQERHFLLPAKKFEN